MGLQFESLAAEKEFDHFCAEWLQKYRHPGSEDLGKVMVRAAEIMDAMQLAPSVSLFERSYRSLLAEGEVKPVFEKLVEPLVEKPEVLTVEAYRAMPAATVARRYMNDRTFRAGVDKLISLKLI
jgi:hypothetical protein